MFRLRKVWDKKDEETPVKATEDDDPIPATPSHDFHRNGARVARRQAMIERIRRGHGG